MLFVFFIVGVWSKNFQKVAMQRSCLIVDQDPYKFCKEDIEIIQCRTTNFSSFCSIGQSNAFCLKLPDGIELTKIIESLPLHRAMTEQLILENGNSFSPFPCMVPTVNVPEGVNLPYEILFQINSLIHHGILSGPKLNCHFFYLLNNEKKSALHICLALIELHKLKSTCFNPKTWLQNQVKKLQTSQNQLRSLTISGHNGTLKFYRALVTPTRVY